MKTKEPPVADGQHQSRIAASLRLSEAKLAGILASAMDAIITVDEDQRIVLFNAAAEKMFRCPASEALGESLDRFIPERFRAAHRDHIRHWMKHMLNRGQRALREFLRTPEFDGRCLSGVHKWVSSDQNRFQISEPVPSAPTVVPSSFFNR